MENWKIFFFCLSFLSRNFTNRRAAGEGGGHFRGTPHYHFHLLHGRLNISPAVSGGSSPQHIASYQSDSNPNSLTTTLRALGKYITKSYIMTKTIEIYIGKKQILTKSIKKSFLIDPLTTNNVIYRDSLTLMLASTNIFIIPIFCNKWI